MQMPPFCVTEIVASAFFKDKPFIALKQKTAVIIVASKTEKINIFLLVNTNIYKLFSIKRWVIHKK